MTSLNRISFSKFVMETEYFSSTWAGYSSPEGTSYVSQCQSDGRWSSTENFRCSPFDCGQPQHVANFSHVSYTTTTFGDTATVTCLPRFSPPDGITLTCDDTGNWAGLNMECSVVDCGEPPPVENSVAHYDDTLLNAEVCVWWSFQKKKNNYR